MSAQKGDLESSTEHAGAGFTDAERERRIGELMPLVSSLARRYAGRGEELDDLEQVGMVGLIKAVDGFDPERGVDLVSYAVPTILGEIKRHFRDRGWSVNVPRRLKDLSIRVNGAIEDLAKLEGRSPSIAAIARYAGLSEEEVLEALEAARAYSTDSLSAPAGTDASDPDLLSTIGREDQAYERGENRQLLADALARLGEREQQIMTLRFFGGLTQSEIARRIGISQMHVSRLIRKSLEQLRMDAEQ